MNAFARGGLPWILVSLSLGLAVDPVRAAPPARPSAGLPFSLNADRVEYEQARDLYTVAGDVRVSQQDGGSLSADWMVFNYTTRIGIAVGNVTVHQSGDLIQTDFARVNLDTLEVLAFDVRIDSRDPDLVVEGTGFATTGAKAYRIENGSFTTCRCPPGRGRRPWEITASTADVAVGSYASARNVAFRTLGVPLLYSPYAYFPVKSERETGFLLPSFARSSRNGAEIALPFFWAASDSVGILFTPESLSERGFKTNGTFEYVFGDSAYSEGGAGLLGERQVDPRHPSTTLSRTRSAFWLRHEQPLGRGARLGLDLKSISDNSYVVDFHDFPDARNARFLESNGWFSMAHGGLYGSVEASVSDDLQSPDDLDRDRFLLKRLPDVHLSMLPREFGVGPLEASANLRYTYFDHSSNPATLRGHSPVRGLFFDTGPDGLFDPGEPDASGHFPGTDVHGDNGAGSGKGEGDGVYQEGEPIADQGQRFEFYPQLTLPYRIGPLETLSAVGWRDTLYLADRGGASRRGLFTASVEAGTRFQRKLQLGRLGLWHRIEPRVELALVSSEDQEKNPLFIPAASVPSGRLTEADLLLARYDPSDRIDRERFLGFSVNNHFHTASGSAGSQRREVAELRLSSGYDLAQGRQTDLFLDARFLPRADFVVSAQLGYDPGEARIDEGTASIGLNGRVPTNLPRSQAARTSQATISYRFLRHSAAPFESFRRKDEAFQNPSDAVSVNQVSLNSSYVLSRNLDIFANGYQSLADTEIRGGGVGVTVFSGCGCWELSLHLSRTTRPIDTRLLLEFRLETVGAGLNLNTNKAFGANRDRR